MIGFIDALSVVVADQARALEFYVNMLGFEVRQDSMMGPDFRFLMVAPPGGQTGIVLFPAGDMAQPGGSFGTVLNTADIAATHAAMASKGVTFEEAPTQQPWGGIQAQFRDPDGNHYILMQLPAEMMPPA